MAILSNLFLGSVLLLLTTEFSVSQEPFDALIFLHTYPVSEDDPGKEHKWMWIQTEQLYFKFQLQACHSAHIAMATHPGDVDSIHYEVVLGEQTYGIKDLRTGEYLKEEQGTLLDCTEYSNFWISWTNATLKFGEGYDLDANTKIEVDKYDAGATRAVSIATGPKIHGYWNIHQDMGRLITVTQPPPTQPGTPNFDYLWLTFEQEPYIVVQIQMCSDARIDLSPTKRTTLNGYDLRIGIDGNTKTVLVDITSGENLTVVETLNILSCNEYRYFWVARQNNYIEFGLGSTIGDNRILYHKTDRAISNLGFATTDAAGGGWRFKHVTADYFTTLTSFDNRKWGEVLLTRPEGVLEVWVKACSGALIALETSSQNVYVVVIGDYENRQTSIQQYKPEGYIVWKIVDSENILSCDVARPFWVSWKSNTIVVGKGYYVNNETLTSWSPTEENLSVNVVFLSTDDYYNKAEWRLQNDAAGVLIRRTNGLASYNHIWYDTTEQTSFIFQVQACGAAFVALTEFMGITGYHGYEIQLGRFVDQGRVALVKDNTDVATGDLTQSLQCKALNQYWVQFQRRENATAISFGEGGDLDSGGLFEYLDNSPYDINAASVTTGEAHIGDWLFYHAQENNFVFRTDAEYNYKYGYVALKSHYFVFDVRTCSHLCFTVSANSDKENMENGRSIEFCLGYDNENSTILDKSNDAFTEVHTPNIVSCSQFRQFWFEWNKNNITVGIGTVHSNPFLYYVGPNEGNVLNSRFVHFSSGGKHTAIVVVPKTSYSLLTIKTDGVEIIPVVESSNVGPYSHSVQKYIIPKYIMAQVTKKHIIFGLKACQEAYIELKSPDNKNNIFLEIGVANNTKTVLRNLDVSREVFTDQILSCDERREFWLWWTAAEVAFGSGGIPGDGRIVTHSEPSANYSTHMLFFATGGMHKGDWEFHEYDADHYMLRTSPGQVNSLEIHTKMEEFLFIVTISASAEVTLAKSDTDYYRLVIGSEGGWGVELYKRENQIAFVNSIKQFTTAAYPRNFWVTWKDNTIQMGTGTEVYVHSVIVWIDEDENDRFTHQITAIKLSSSTATGYWSFPKHYGNATVYHSPENNNYFGLKATTRNTESLVFRVKACNQALLALSHIPGVITEKTYEIVIEDGITILRNGTGGEMLDEFPTLGGLLDCKHYRSFWLSWTDYIIKLGTGNAVGAAQFLNFFLPDKSYTVNQVAFSTGESTGSWMFSALQGDFIHAHTTLVFDWNKIHSQMWMCNNRKYVEFAVRTSDEARIALSMKPRVAKNDTYEVILAENGKSEAAIYYKNSQGAVTENSRTNNFNSFGGGNYRTFWISWFPEDTHIKVGSGQLYQQEFMSSAGVTLHDINSISFATGNKSSGDWAFLQSTEDSLLVQSREFYYGPDFSITITERTYLVFQIKACAHAEVRLTSQFGNDQQNVYQIIIGDNNNARTLIRDNIGGEAVAEKDTDNFLSCDHYRAFWVSWKSGFIKVGQGAWIDVDIIIEWQDPSEDLRDVVQAFLQTGNQDIGLWELIDIDGESYTVFTGGDHTYETVWIKPKQNHYIDFKVKACQDGHVALYVAESENPKGRLLYEIVFGASGNENTVIRNESLTYNVAKAHTPGILSCSHFRTFWIAWENGLVAVGVGNYVTRYTVVTYQDPNSFAVTAVSFSTYGGVEGEFKFTEQTTQEIYLQGRDVGAYSYTQFWHVILGKDYFFFRVKAPSDVYVILTTVPHVTTVDAYEFRIGIDNNQRTELEKRKGDVISQDSPDVLKEEEFVTFWLHWGEGNIQLGKGTTIGNEVIISMQDTEFNINAFSITSQLGVIPEWEFVPVNVDEPSTDNPNTGTQHSTTSTAANSPGSTGIGGTDSPQNPPPSGALSAGAIVGITFGVIGFLMIAALGVILVVRLRQLKNYNQFIDEDDATDGSGFSGPGVAWDNPNYNTDIQLQQTGVGNNNL